MIRFPFFIVILSLCLTLTGCPAQQAPSKPSPSGEGTSAPAATEDHEEEFHSHTVGPKGGVLAVLGHHQYHAEFLADAETGDISALVYNDHFKPVALDAKEVTLNIMVGGEPKQFTFLVDNDGSDGNAASYKISDAALAKLIKEGWEGNAQVSITVKGTPASGQLAQPEK